MKPLQLDTAQVPSTATTRPQPAHAAIDDWQRAWQTSEDEGELQGGSGSNSTAEANRNDSVGLKSDLQVGAANEQVELPTTGDPCRTNNAPASECRSDFSPMLSPESGTATGLAPGPQVNTEAGTGARSVAGDPSRATSTTTPECSAGLGPALPPESATAVGLKSDLQPPTPRPLKAGQLAWQSTQAMAQRARRSDASGEIQPSAPQQQLAPLAAPMLAPPLPPAAPQLPGELLLAAVERMLVTEPDGDGAQQVHLTFADDWFSETAVTLQRTDSGWQLDIASASPRITAALRGACNELGSRFAQRGLGRLDTRIRTTRNWDALEEAT